MDKNNNISLCSATFVALQTGDACGKKNWRPPWPQNQNSTSTASKNNSACKNLPHHPPSFIGLAPVLLAMLVYMNSMTGDFVHDDIPAIVNNPDVNGANPAGVLGLFSNDFWGEPMTSPRSHKSYRPLTILLFR